MAKLIGNNPSQIPTNGDLGSMAFEDRKNYATTSSPIYQPFRNIIINGDMSIAQRGTSQASAGSSNGSYQTIDRFKFYNASLGVFTQSQDTDVPTGQGFANSMKFDCTTADASPAAGDYLFFHQRIEGQFLQYLKFGTANAESLTLSFWVKSNKTGTYITECRNKDNNRDFTKAYTINSANTWEKKTLTFSGDATAGFINDNNISLEINFWLATGSDFSSGTLQSSWYSTNNTDRAVGQVNLADSTANNFWITGIQLEAGTSASDFEFLPYDVNRERCYRYYQKWDSLGQLYFLVGHVWSTTLCQYAKNFYPNFRAHPSIEYAGTLRNLSSTSAVDLSSLTIDSSSSTQGQGRAGKINGNMSSSSFTSGNSCALLLNSNGAYVALDAEL